VLNAAIPTLAVLILLTLYIPTLFARTPDSIPPLDTYFLIALWLWCGWLWLAQAGLPAGK
jgi:hypothetical protein